MQRNFYKFGVATILTGLITLVFVYHFDKTSDFVANFNSAIVKSEIKRVSFSTQEKVKVVTNTTTTTTQKPATVATSKATSISVITTTTVQKPHILTYDELFNYTRIDYSDYSVNGTKHILFFTTLWSQMNWWMSSDTINKDSKELKSCAVNNCVFTSNRNYLKNIHEYDALFFHLSQRFWTINDSLKPITTRSPSQLYVFATQE